MFRHRVTVTRHSHICSGKCEVVWQYIRSDSSTRTNQLAQTSDYGWPLNLDTCTELATELVLCKAAVFCGELDGTEYERDNGDEPRQYASVLCA